MESITIDALFQQLILKLVQVPLGLRVIHQHHEELGGGCLCQITMPQCFILGRLERLLQPQHFPDVS